MTIFNQSECIKHSLAIRARFESKGAKWIKIWKPATKDVIKYIKNGETDCDQICRKFAHLGKFLCFKAKFCCCNWLNVEKKIYPSAHTGCSQLYILTYSICNSIVSVLFFIFGPNPATFCLFSAYSQYNDNYNKNLAINEKNVGGVLGI